MERVHEITWNFQGTRNNEFRLQKKICRPVACKFFELFRFFSFFRFFRFFPPYEIGLSRSEISVSAITPNKAHSVFV